MQIKYSFLYGNEYALCYDASMGCNVAISKIQPFNKVHLNSAIACVILAPTCQFILFS